MLTPLYNHEVGETLLRPAKSSWIGPSTNVPGKEKVSTLTPQNCHLQLPLKNVISTA